MALTQEERQKKESQILCLIADLTSTASEIGDWKVMKCTEAKLLGEDLPYDLEALHEKRKAVRDEINKLQEELDADSAAE